MWSHLFIYFHIFSYIFTSFHIFSHLVTFCHILSHFVTFSNFLIFDNIKSNFVMWNAFYMRTTSLESFTGCGRCGGRCSRHSNFLHFITLKSHFLWVGVVSAVVVAQEATLRTKIFFAEFDSGSSAESRKHSLTIWCVWKLSSKILLLPKSQNWKCYIVRTAGKIIGFIEI